MKDIYTLYEASLLDIEGTIESGDKYAKVMNEIKKELKVLQSMKWNEDWTTTIGEHQYEWYCPKFIEHYLGVKAHSILFTVNLYNSGSREHDCDTQMFIYDKNKDYYSTACRDFLCNSKIYSTQTKMIKAIVDEIKDKFKESNLSRTLVRLKDLVNLERFEKVNEASLLDIEGTIEQGDIEAEKLTTFGKRFTLTGVQNLTDTTAGALFKFGALKKLTANMDYMTDTIERGQFDKKKLCKMFCNLLDHLTYEQIGLATHEIQRDFVDRDIFKNVFALRLQEWCYANKILKGGAHIYCPSAYVCDPNEFRIIIELRDKRSIAIQLKYKIN